MLVAGAQVARRVVNRGQLMGILVEAKVCLLDVKARPLHLAHPLVRHDSRVVLLRGAAPFLPVGAAQIGLVGHRRSDARHRPGEGRHGRAGAGLAVERESMRVPEADRRVGPVARRIGQPARDED